MRDFVIYFIKCNEFVKIGHSSDPRARLSNLQVGNPYPLELIGTCEGGEKEEAWLHAAFDMFHNFGEWFFYSKAIEAFVAEQCEILEEISLPKPTAPKPRKENHTLRKYADALIDLFENGEPLSGSDVSRTFRERGLTNKEALYHAADVLAIRRHGRVSMTDPYIWTPPLTWPSSALPSTN